MATVALNALEDSLKTGFLPKMGCSPGGQAVYSGHVTLADAGGGRLSLWANTSSGGEKGEFVSRFIPNTNALSRLIQYIKIQG